MKSKKNKPIYLKIILLSTLLLLLAGIMLTKPTINTIYRTNLLHNMKQSNTYKEFTNHLFCYEITSDSITCAYTLKNPQKYHIPKLSPTMDSINPKKENKSLEIIENKLSEFQKKKLSNDDKLSLNLITNSLTLNAKLSEYPYYQELLGGTSGIQANLPVTFGEYPLHNKTDVENYLGLLKCIPSYFNDIIKYEKRRSRNFDASLIYANAYEKTSKIYEGLQQENNSFILTFSQRIDNIKELSPKQKQYYKRKNIKYVKKYVVPSYNHICEYLEKSSHFQLDSKKPYGLSSLPKGKDYYSLLTKQSTGSSKSPQELITMTEAALKDAMGIVLQQAISNPELYKFYCEQSIDAPYKDPANILEALSLYIRSDYPLLPSKPNFKVKNVAESLASSLSPAFYMIPEIDSYKDNTIYINPLQIKSDDAHLFTTLAHEGFPGHLYQTVYFNSTHPNPIRQILNYPGFVEGWATYVELNAYKYLDYPDKMHDLCSLYQAETIISLALSTRVDIGVNYESWTLEDVNKYFESLGFKSYYCKDLYSYVTEAPSNYLSYFIGYLEFNELKEEYQNKMKENYTEIEFHKKILDVGPCDFDTLRKYVLN